MRQFKGNCPNGNGGDGQASLLPNVKLPRTGIEQIFCADRPRFIETHREFERVANPNVSVPRRESTPSVPLSACMLLPGGIDPRAAHSSSHPRDCTQDAQQQLPARSWR